MKFKILLFLCLVFSIFIPKQIFAQKPSAFAPELISWKLVLDANQAFYNGEYGKALKLANNALVNRQIEVDWSLYVLENATKSAAFQRIDYLDEIYEMLIERDEHEAVILLESIFLKHGFEIFENSFKKLYTFVGTQKEYPEVYFIIAQVYMIEGERALAEQYFLKAYEFADLLIVPAQKYDILYELFDLYVLTKEIQKQEKTLLLIISDDPHYNQSKTSTSLIHTASRAIQTKTDLDKFFLLYHSKSLFAMKAYYELAKIYAQNENNKTLVLQVLSLAAITAFDRIETIIKQRNFGYSFESFDSLLKLALKYDDVLDWMQNENVWGIFFYLAENAKELNLKFSKDLLIEVSKHCPDSYWKKRALEAYIN